MDQGFLKWMAEAMAATASHLSALDKLSSVWTPANQDFSRRWASLPGVPQAPYPPEKMEQLYREWLIVFGAVPRKDYERLERKLAAAQEQSERLKKAMAAMARGFSGYGEAPELMKPWLELIERSAAANVEWFSEFTRLFEKMRQPPSARGESKDNNED